MNPLRYFREQRRAYRRRCLIADVMRVGGVSEAVATKTVDRAASKYPLWDWFKSLDWNAILKLVLALLPLILAEEKEDS